MAKPFFCTAIGLQILHYDIMSNLAAICIQYHTLKCRRKATGPMRTYEPNGVDRLLVLLGSCEF